MKKFRVYTNSQRKEVTGLIVNEKVNVKRRFVRQIRAMIHAWKKYGYDNAHSEFNERYNLDNGAKELEDVIKSKINFIRNIKGEADSVWKNLAFQFNSCCPKNPISFDPTLDETVRQATWVVECEEIPSQGTAFRYADIGFITCAHCIGDVGTGKIGENVYMYHPEWKERYEANVKRVDWAKDLAILEMQDNVNTLSVSDVIETDTGQIEEIYLYGYPNHKIAQPIRVEKGKGLRKFPISGVSYIEVTHRIIEGNSGGPIVDGSGYLIGIANRGITQNTPENSAEYLAIASESFLEFLQNILQ